MRNPQKTSVNVWHMKMLKNTVTKKVIVCFHLLYLFGFYNLGEENFQR